MTDTYTHTETEIDAELDGSITRAKIINDIVSDGGNRDDAEATVDHLIDRGVYSEYVDGSLRVNPVRAIWYTAKLELCKLVPGLTPATPL